MRSLLLAVLSIFSLSAQKNKSVDFLKIDAEILPIADLNEIVGRATFDFEMNSKVDSIFIDAIDMTILYVALNGKEIEYSNSRKRLGFKAPSATGNHKLFVRYIAKPKQTVYFFNAVTEENQSDRDPSLTLRQAQGDNYLQIWTQGQGKYTSHWLPSFDDMTEKVELDLTILADEEYEVIANGQLVSKIVEDGIAEWKFDMLDPMSSYLAAFVIGNFDKTVLKSRSGIPIELYYESKDSLKVEPTYRYTKEIFDFLEEEIGFPYPWQNYKQIPVKDFLYAGMENTGTTIFSNQYMIDSTAFLDKNYVNVNAHEMAHQWFGNLVTEESGKHHWLHEGFATYYAYLAELHLFGDDHFYWKLFETAKTLNNLSENGDGEALINPNANSLTFYEKGAWALVALREQVGEEAFKMGIKTYLNKQAYGNATITDFLSAMEKASKVDLGPFKEKWLVNEEFPWEEVKSYLRTKNTSLKRFFEIQRKTTDSAVFDQEKFMELWGDEMPKPFKREFLFNYGTQLPDSTLVMLIENESVEVRQAVAMSLSTISETLRPSFESMLKDKSFVTQETVLFKLWQAFPENRTQYLDELNGVVGLPNKNVSQLWLILALITEGFQPENKKAFYEDLNRHTASHYNFEVRQLAFQYLYQIDALSDESLLNLINSSEHHVWQFKKSSRNLIRTLAMNEKLKERLLSVSSSLTLAQRNTLNKLMNQ